MKKFFIILLILMLITLAAYISFFSIESVDKGDIGYVIDKRTGEVVRTFHGLDRKRTFLWQGAMSWWYSIHKLQMDRIGTYDIKIAIPGLKELKEDYYFIRVPVKIEYRIDARKFKYISMLKDDCMKIDERVKRIVEDALSRGIAPYSAPAYKREALIAETDSILDGIVNTLESNLSSLGLNLTRIQITGTLEAPERVVYNEGIRHAEEMRVIDKVNEIKLKNLRSKVEREKLHNVSTYSKLREMSRIIKQNPDILKYIYIDKMAGNVKVILSSDKTGMPGMFGDFEKETPIPKGKEIDNLR